MLQDPEELEATFQKFISDLPVYAPDGILEIDVETLEELDQQQDQDPSFPQEDVTQSFYIFESEDKLTLFNEKFLVWIVPQVENDLPKTVTFIALNDATKQRLEMVFSTSGIFNQSNLVLQLLEHYLLQISENEQIFSKFDHD